MGSRGRPTDVGKDNNNTIRVVSKTITATVVIREVPSAPVVVEEGGKKHCQWHISGGDLRYWAQRVKKCQAEYYI